jgi:hypothetical protein
MTRLIQCVMVLGLGLGLACDSKPDDSKKAADKKAETKGDAKKADAKVEEKKAADAKVDAPTDVAKAEPAAALAPDKEIDLSPWGPEFKGWVVMAPEGSKVELDDTSRQLSISETDFISVSEAPGYADAVKGLAGDKDNSNIKVVSDTEARWERNPPLGKQWNFDIKMDVGGKPWSCNGATFTDAAMADKLVAICKSMKKK